MGVIVLGKQSSGVQHLEGFQPLTDMQIRMLLKTRSLLFFCYLKLFLKDSFPEAYNWVQGCVHFKGDDILSNCSPKACPSEFSYSCWYLYYPSFHASFYGC